jgi:hypothetical protein
MGGEEASRTKSNLLMEMTKMGKYLMAAMVAVMGLAWASEAQAGPLIGVRVGPVAVGVGGRPYRGGCGYYYPGHHHNHWAYRRWDPVYRRYHYYDPGLRAFFYYDAGRGGYYPVTVAIR